MWVLGAAVYQADLLHTIPLDHTVSPRIHSICLTMHRIALRNAPCRVGSAAYRPVYAGREERIVDVWGDCPFLSYLLSL